MYETLLCRTDFRDTAPYDPNSGPIQCHVLQHQVNEFEFVLSTVECYHPDLICFECPFTKKIRGREHLAELPFQVSETPYGLEKHCTSHGYIGNLLRTDLGAQVNALKPGDILATNEKVLSNPREGGNGTVWIHINGRFVGIPSRIPVAFQNPFALPSDLKVGDTLLTGEEILAEPYEGENGDICIKIDDNPTRGSIPVPKIIPIALSTES